MTSWRFTPAFVRLLSGSTRVFFFFFFWGKESDITRDITLVLTGFFPRGEKRGNSDVVQLLNGLCKG